MPDIILAPGLPDMFKDHAARYLSSGGTDGHIYTITRPDKSSFTVPALLVTTTGRQSGRKYIFPLFYTPTEKGYCVIASKGGAPEHPGWYLNILANPNVDLQVGTAKLQARARTVGGAERARLWEQAVESFPPYADYEQKARPREIPVVVLEPLTTPEP